jgi:molybdopterin synthase catalytic subunit
LKAHAPFWKREEGRSGASWVDARDHYDAAASRWTER